MEDAGILALRVATAVVMLLHGYYKFQKKSLFDRKWRDDYGLPQGSVLLTGVLQVVGGLALVAGLYTRVAALVLLLVMVVATYISTVKHREPFLSTPEGKGWDINFMLVGTLVALMLTGGGRWALTEW